MATHFSTTNLHRNWTYIDNAFKYDRLLGVFVLYHGITHIQLLRPNKYWNWGNKRLMSIFSESSLPRWHPLRALSWLWQRNTTLKRQISENVCETTCSKRTPDTVGWNEMKAPKILSSAPKFSVGRPLFPPTDLASVWNLASHWMCRHCRSLVTDRRAAE